VDWQGRLGTLRRTVERPVSASLGAGRRDVAGSASRSVVEAVKGTAGQAMRGKHWLVGARGVLGEAGLVRHGSAELGSVSPGAAQHGVAGKARRARASRGSFRQDLARRCRHVVE